MTSFDPPRNDYQIVYADPPWSYYGDPNKNAAAGKHYPLMTMEELEALPVLDFCHKNCWLFMWATPARLHMATDLIGKWGFHYRNVAYIWTKTTKERYEEFEADGEEYYETSGGYIISDRQGVRPTYTKTAWFELLLVAGTTKTGRVTPIASEAHPSLIPAPRGKHSAKPWVFRDLIAGQLGQDLPKLEMFARETRWGWDSWGNEV